MEILLPYICKWVTIILVAVILILLAKYGIPIRRVKHGSTEVEFDNIKINPQEQVTYGCNERNGGENFKLFRIFLGSPSGLGPVREAFCEAINFFSEIDAHKRKIIFFVERWENIPATYERPQSVINQKLAQCNCYFLVLYDKWGNPPGENEGISYSSGSEEEFSKAEQWFNAEGHPMKKIAVYFKTVEAEKLEAPDGQLTKVIDFKKIIERDHKLLYGEFGDVDEFKRKVHIFMTEWLEQIAPWGKPVAVRNVRYKGRETN